MSSLGKILRYELQDLARSRWAAGYLLFFLVFAEALLRLEASPGKVLLNLIDVVLLLLPLASAVFGTIYLYSAREFIELLLSQPVGRRRLFAGLYLALALALSGAFVLGTATPFVLRGMDAPAEWGTLAAVCAAGVLLTAVSVALAFLVALRIEDRMKGLATVILGWLVIAILYDGGLLLLLNLFADYPVDRALLAATAANPVDLARMLLLLRFDVAALMGYTGEVFQRFLTGGAGLATASLAAALWLGVPLALGARAFRRKDF